MESRGQLKLNKTFTSVIYKFSVAIVLVSGKQYLQLQITLVKVLLNSPHNIFIAQHERLDDGVHSPLTRMWNLIAGIRNPGHGIQHPRLLDFPYVG